MYDANVGMEMGPWITWQDVRWKENGWNGRMVPVSRINAVVWVNLCGGQGPC